MARKKQRPRKACTVKEALWMVINQGGSIPCGLSGELITKEELEAFGAIERDHIGEHAFGVADTKENWHWVKKEPHKIKTNGNGATTAGSSKHRIRKADRLEKARTSLEVGEEDAAPLAKPKQKMQGRGFSTTHTKKFNGKTELRKGK